MSKAFGTLKPNLYQSDYITRKNARLLSCNIPNNLRSSSQYDLYKKGKYLFDVRCKKYLIDESHLAYGLYKKKDLTNICSVIEGHPCTNYTCPQCLDPVPITELTDTDPAFYKTNSTFLSTF
jgi:hypothetical protein